MANDDRSRDMVLAPNEYMYVSDKTKGNIDIFVGPTKQSLSGTDQPVIFDERSKRFIEVDLMSQPELAKQLAKTAPEGWYIVLKNPAKNNKQPTPNSGKLSSAELDVGKKVIVPGPVSFCLWPGQMAKILKGHHLRSNQYLLVRVYDEEEARHNWKKAVIKTVSASEVKAETKENNAIYHSTKEDLVLADSSLTDSSSVDPTQDPPKLTMGQVLVIKGTDVSFYIPPTGIEVVPDLDVLDSAGKPTLVREAVTLERLEYCLLMNEQGSKRYERGPAVVFPEPTEVFITREGNDGEPVRKFRAIELSENSGIYIKVIAPYKEDNINHPVGEELFITGKQQMIYFPREEHAIVKYDKSEIHYAIAIPAGEARYVLDRNKGTVSKVEGPAMFLPDPRTQVIVRRIIPYKICSMLYPDNISAFTHNAKLAGVDLDTYMSRDGAEVVVAAAAAAPAVALNLLASADYEPAMYGSSMSLGSQADSRGLGGKVGTKAAGDSFQRKTKYTEPRTVVLSTKYDGAVTINVYTGYAVLLVKSDGSRRIVQGPKTVLLDYDEVPEIMELSTGKPKTTDKLYATVYLRTKANKISDIIDVETADFCKFQIKLSYRMDFTGDPESWFGVENYVKFLCDNLRSRLKNVVRKFGVEQFYHNNTDIIRGAVLKETTTSEGSVLGPRLFKENGMQIYDVEVLSVSLVNKDIEQLISNSQKSIIQTTIALANQQRTLEASIEEETIKQKMAEIRSETNARILQIEADESLLKMKKDETSINAQAETTELKLKRELEAQLARNAIEEARRRNEQEAIKLEFDKENRVQDLKIRLIQTEIKAVVDKANAITPDLIAALQAFGDNQLVIKAAESMSPLAILGGNSVAEVISKLLAGTKLENIAKLASSNTTNGGNGQSVHRS